MGLKLRDRCLCLKSPHSSQPAFVQPPKFPNHVSKSKDPPCYEDAVKQTRSLQSAVQVTIPSIPLWNQRLLRTHRSLPAPSRVPLQPASIWMTCLTCSSRAEVRGEKRSVLRCCCGAPEISDRYALRVFPRDLSLRQTGRHVSGNASPRHRQRHHPSHQHRSVPPSPSGPSGPASCSIAPLQARVSRPVLAISARRDARLLRFTRGYHGDGL